MEEIATLSSCPGAGCHEGCTHITRVKDGKIVKTERIVYPDGEEGTICLKGLAGSRLPYHPDRLKYPLRRTGKRGEGKWERVTWDQALDEIAAKIRKISKEYKPESIAIMPMLNSVTPGGGIQPVLLGYRLQNLLQATDLYQGCPIDSGPEFSNYFTLGTSFASIMDPRTLLEGDTKYMIAWGCNPAERSFRFMRYIGKAREKGAKLVDIGLVYDSTAAKADWWIPVKAGSDTALALAMISVIINEELYDEEYIVKYTNGPFLVRTDNGEFLRESDIHPEGDARKYVVWDIASDQPKAIAPKTYESPGITPALFGSYKPGMIDCRPAFQILADLANKHLPEKVEEITGVSPETVEKLAREYSTAKPAAILIGCGLRYKNSGNALRAMDALGAITGNIGVSGGGTIFGGIFFSHPINFNDIPIIFPSEARARALPMTQAFQGMITGKPYPIKALVMYCMNPLHTFPNPRRWIEEIFPNLELIVVNDIFMTATAEYADYVLPDCTVFEREDLYIAPGGHIVLQEKAIEPMHECKPPLYFWSGLADRLGMGGYFTKTIEEWIEFRLKSEDPSIAGIQPPLTMERLKKEKIIRANTPKEIYHPFLDKKYLTPSGRVEVYCEELLAAGDALPVFREQLESPRSALAEKHPLVFYTGNKKFFMHTIFANDPLMLELYESEPHIYINPLDATKRNIGNGDVVKVYNDRGSCTVKATISEAIPPGVVHLPHGWWPKQFIAGHVQNLVMSLATSETRDEAREVFWSIAAERNGVRPFGETWFAYSPDTIFDCLCEVERVEKCRENMPF